jgi:hypothetical protein
MQETIHRFVIASCYSISVEGKWKQTDARQGEMRRLCGNGVHASEGDDGRDGGYEGIVGW